VGLTIEAETAPLRIHYAGTIYVGETRIPIDTAVEAYLKGHSAEEIVEQYPTIKIGDADAVITYYLRHQPEVDAYLEARRVKAEQVRRDYETRFPSKAGLRVRLLAKQSLTD
jgi:uncharacterized protein (DUF433 family)